MQVSSRLPSNKQRSVLVHSLVSALGLISNHGGSETHRMQVANPRRATLQDLELYHSKEYLDYVLDQNAVEDERLSAELGLEDDCPRFPGLADYVQLVAGASLAAANALKLASISICWDGGRYV